MTEKTHPRAAKQIENPKIIGGYKIGTMIITSEKKPNIVNRFLMKKLLGLQWIDLNY